MKKFSTKGIIIIILFVAFIFIVNSLKNVYLYNSYHHGEYRFIKLEGGNNTLSGQWLRILDTWEGGHDERHFEVYNFNDKLKGTYSDSIYSIRVNGKMSIPYSWKALLPFKKNEYDLFSIKISADSEFIKFYPDSNTIWSDTIYAKYEIKLDSLYIDKHRREFRYNKILTPDEEFSEKIHFYKLPWFKIY